MRWPIKNLIFELKSDIRPLQVIKISKLLLIGENDDGSIDTYDKEK